MTDFLGRHPGPDGGLRQLAHRLRSGATTPTELLASSRERIAAVDEQIGAFTWLDEAAWEQAEKLGTELISGRDRGPLHGIPVGVKELFDVADAPRTYGSTVLDQARCAVDAHVVARLRDAGAVIVGTTRSHEFGWGITTQHGSASTRNPWDIGRIPGGSSGGSAAAVAAGMVPVAVASDTGGSIRIPAAFCGVAGIKPTFGRISRTGGVPLAPSFDTPGFIATCVRDLVAATGIASAVDPGDPATVLARLPDLDVVDSLAGRTDLTGLRIGYSPNLGQPSDATDRTRALDAALDLARDLGAELVELDTPTGEQFRSCFATIQMAEALHVHRDLLHVYPERADRYGADVRGRLEAAQSVTLPDLLAATDLARRLNAALAYALTAVDCLLTTVSAVAPPPASDADNAVLGDRRIPLREVVMAATTPQNLGGLPSVAFPFGIASDGLPIGLQATARAGREAMTLRVAMALEREPVPVTPIRTTAERSGQWPR